MIKINDGGQKYIFHVVQIVFQNLLVGKGGTVALGWSDFLSSEWTHYHVASNWFGSAQRSVLCSAQYYAALSIMQRSVLRSAQYYAALSIMQYVLLV